VNHLQKCSCTSYEPLRFPDTKNISTSWELRKGIWLKHSSVQRLLQLSFANMLLKYYLWFIFLHNTQTVSHKFYTIVCVCVCVCVCHSFKSCSCTGIKGKAVPLQAWNDPEGSRKLRFPDYMTTAQDGALELVKIIFLQWEQGKSVKFGNFGLSLCNFNT
jgi:hypothetical protein